MTALEFNQKVVQVEDSLTNSAMGLTKDFEDAKDLVQETLYKAMANRDKFKEGTNLKAWLYTIMKNIFINNYRRRRKQNTIFDSTDNLYLINSAGENLPNEGESALNMEDIERNLRKIKKAYRKPFLMHFQGFKYDEIAEEEELPIGTVKSRIHLARKMLKEKLAPMNDN